MLVLGRGLLALSLAGIGAFLDSCSCFIEILDFQSPRSGVAETRKPRQAEACRGLFATPCSKVSPAPYPVANSSLIASQVVRLPPFSFHRCGQDYWCTKAERRLRPKSETASHSAPLL